MTAFPRWAEKLYNRPLALEPFKNEVLCEFAQAHITGVSSKSINAATLEIAATRASADDATFYSEGERKDFRSKDGIAVIDLRGTLVHRASWMDAESGLVGYDRVMRQARAAKNDPEIGGMFLRFDSSGGDCAGMFAAAEELAGMAKAEGGKPIYAYLDERACSAAYVMASACDKVFGRKEVLGASIAAIINVLDTSKEYEKMGIEPIVIRPEWADRKARGQDGEKIDADTIKRLRAMVDETSAQIVEFVAAMRRKTEKSIRDLRGEVLRGPDLVRAGLMDAIHSESVAWTMLKDEIRSA